MKKVIVLMILCVLFSSCVSVKNITSAMKIQDLELKPDYELLDMKVVVSHAREEKTTSSRSYDGSTGEIRDIETTTTVIGV